MVNRTKLDDNISQQIMWKNSKELGRLHARMLMLMLMFMEFFNARTDDEHADRVKTKISYFGLQNFSKRLNVTRTDMSQFSRSLVAVDFNPIWSFYMKIKDPKNRSYNLFSVIKCNQLWSRKTSCHWFFLLLLFFWNITRAKSGKKIEWIWPPIKNFLRNSWNWEK